MRTNIELNETLLASAMKASGLATKRATIEEALRLYVQAAEQRQALDELRGMGWDGDLDETRRGWSRHQDWAR